MTVQTSVHPGPPRAPGTATRRWRTLHIDTNADDTIGGSHRALYDLVTGMDRDRFEPVVMFYRDNPYMDRLEARGIEVHSFDDVNRREYEIRISGKRLAKYWDFGAAVMRRAAFIRDHAIDLVHLNNSPYHGSGDWLPAARLRGIPCMASAMGGPPRSARGILRRITWKTDRVVAVSRHIADLWTAWGSPDERVVVVHHGVHAAGIRARARGARDDTRRRLQVPDDRLLVAMVGNVRHWKGQHVVLEALTHLPPEVRDRLLVVFAGAVAEGDKGYAAGLEAYVEEHGLESCTRFLGFRNDVPEIMAACDVAVHASVIPEPGGIVVLEAMAMGVAIIAADEGGHTEVMVDGTGLLFDTTRPTHLAEQLTLLAGDPDLRGRMGAAAGERIADFSVERNVRETEALYEELLGA